MYDICRIRYPFLKRYTWRQKTPLTVSYLRGGGGSADFALLMFFFHHPETAPVMKLKFSDLKDTRLRHILQVIPGC